MHYMTIAEAAKHANVDRSTISRKIKAGQLSATHLANGQKGIDPAELERVYPVNRPRARASTASTQQQANEQDDDLHAAYTQDLRDHIRRLERLLDQANEREAQLLRILDGRLLPPPPKMKKAKKAKKKKR